MATVVEFACPRCSASCSCHSRPGEIVRCPHCYSFITVPDDEPPQFKVVADEPALEAPMIVFRCPYCQSRIETDTANAGLACLCPGCHAGLTIPGNAHPIFLRPDSHHDRDLASQHVPAGAIVLLVTLCVLLIVILVNLIR